MQGVVQSAGGDGEFETVTLGTSAYEALYSGDVDFTVPYVAWEGIEAEHRGVDLKTFAYTDYGFPDAYQVLVVGNNTWLEDIRILRVTLCRLLPAAMKIPWKTLNPPQRFCRKKTPACSLT
jgi:NMT1/THI5 like.